MHKRNFVSNSNLQMLGIAAVAVTVMTLILSRGNFVAAIGAGMGTATSIYVCNRRLFNKLSSIEQSKLLKEELKELERTLRKL